MGIFPCGSLPWAALLIGEVIGWVLVDKHIVSAWEKLCNSLGFLSLVADAHWWVSPNVSGLYKSG